MGASRSMHRLLALSFMLVLAACRASGDGSTEAAAPDEPEAVAVASAVPASPWDAAAARGVGFRAVGNEPGWYAEVDRGATPVLRAVLDYGDRTIEVPRATVLDDDASGYHGTAPDGTPVVLRIRRETCSDGMSDNTYQTSAELSVGESTYHGCGRFLPE